MRRERLKPRLPDELLEKYYALPHDNGDNADHRVRVDVTIAIGKALAPYSTVADLSCGDAAVASGLDAMCYLGDLGVRYPIQGPIDETLDQIPHVDLFVCTETVEHLDDPDTTLKLIRPKTDALLLSTPVGCWHDTNYQHYWAWDREAVEAMADGAGFKTVVYAELDLTAAGPHHYRFGIWGMR